MKGDFALPEAFKFGLILFNTYYLVAQLGHSYRVGGPKVSKSNDS